MYFVNAGASRRAAAADLARQPLQQGCQVVAALPCRRSGGQRRLWVPNIGTTLCDLGILVEKTAESILPDVGGIFGDAVALSAVTSNNWSPRTQHPRKDPLSCVA
jgi:hypothetical protein